MHGKATQSQIFVGTEWIADVSIGYVGLFVSETVNRHREKFHAVLKVVIHIWSRSAFYVQVAPFQMLPIQSRRP